MKTKLLLIALVVSLVGVGIQSYRLNKEQEAHTKTATAFTTYIAEQMAYNTTEGQRRVNEIDQIRREGDEKLTEANTMLDRIHLERDGLRSENARLRATRNPAAASQCKTEYERIRVLTGLLDECTEKYTALAGTAQRSRISGLMCEKSYDAVRK